MKSGKKSSDHGSATPKQAKVEVRNDLEDASKGKDLSYLNEMPQMGGYEGVKAGVRLQRKITMTVKRTAWLTKVK